VAGGIKTYVLVPKWSEIHQPISMAIEVSRSVSHPAIRTTVALPYSNFLPGVSLMRTGTDTGEHAVSACLSALRENLKTGPYYDHENPLYTDCFQQNVML
jgi:hypothetical protein